MYRVTRQGLNGLWRAAQSAAGTSSEFELDAASGSIRAV